MNLILGCGPHKVAEKNDVLVDIRPFPNVHVVHDLNVRPWPWKDNEATHIQAIHVVEHLHCLLIPFMDEAWRVLRPGGSLYLETPLAGVDPDLEFGDPTHVRCYRVHSFANYLSLEGAERFGYTTRAWNFFYLHHRQQDNILVVHAYPLKH